MVFASFIKDGEALNETASEADSFQWRQAAWRILSFEACVMALSEKEQCDWSNFKPVGLVESIRICNALSGESAVFEAMRETIYAIPGVSKEENGNLGFSFRDGALEQYGYLTSCLDEEMRIRAKSAWETALSWKSTIGDMMDSEKKTLVKTKV